MVWNILKKDIKRKKTMNIIIFLFIVLASMFVASGVNNIVTTINGSDYYFEKAGVGDYVALTQRGDGGLTEILSSEKAVKNFSSDELYFADDKAFRFNGKEIKDSKTLIIQSLAKSGIKFFDKNNEEIKNVEPGKVYISVKCMKNNHLKEGDEVTYTFGNTSLKLTVAGGAKDALFGSDMMGNTRFLINESDYEKLDKDPELDMYKGRCFYIDTDKPGDIKAALSDAKNVLFSADKSVLKMTYVMDMIVAMIVLVLSVCLIIVSFVVLKFTIRYSITEEYREIGVMKAIGIRNRKIRSLYIVKYLAISVVGAMLGFVFSIPFGNMLMKSVTENMVLGNNGGYFINAIGAVIVIGATMLFAYGCTRKIKKITPVDAIRNGQNGESFKKKAGYSIKKSHCKTSFYLALNDILCKPKRFITIMISFFISSIFVLGLVIVTETMNSKKLINTFCLETDLYVDKSTMEYMKDDGREDLVAYLDEIEDKLADRGYPCETSIEIMYIYKITVDGKAYSIQCQQGINTNIEDYEYRKGTAPKNANEIAITRTVSRITGAKIGDVVTIDFDGDKRECMVTAYFESMSQLGEVIRLHQDAPTSFKSISSLWPIQVDFNDDPSDKEIKNRAPIVEEITNCREIRTAAQFCRDCIGVVDTMEAVKYLLLAITIIVVILVTILMERSFISNEKGQIALLKAIGFKNSDIIKWHLWRFVIVGVAVELLAAALSIPITRLWCNPVFGMMGARHIKYAINPLKLFLIYPGIILATTVLIAWITALYTKTIKSIDTASIE